MTTEECDADIAYKEAYINAKEEDIVIVKSPVGMPGRAIKNKFLERVAQGPVKVERCFRCLEHCNPAETPYCITKALINAAEGKIDEALLFCGSYAYRCEKIPAAIIPAQSIFNIKNPAFLSKSATLRLPALEAQIRQTTT